jgi:Rad3-related DNA helicase
MNEYRPDKQFAAAVDLARVALAEWLEEEIVKLADEAHDLEDAAALALKVRMREKLRDRLLPRYKEARSAKAIDRGKRTGAAAA